MYKKNIWLLPVILLLSAKSARALFFDGLINDLLILEKINETNRTQLAHRLKQLLVGDADQEPKSGVSPNPELSSFDDLPGMPEDLREIIEFFTNSEKFARLGAHIPSGILLYGPPGTGKTSAARIIAQQCGAAFFECSASSFIEIYVGTGAQHVRQLFEKAREHEKAIIFIDEIDAIGGARGGWENSERTNTLNELLSQMDGFKKHPGILVIAATNRIDMLDQALLRPGRFDRLIKIDLPTVTIRAEILASHCQHILFIGSDKCLDYIAKQTDGFSGADLKNIVDEAAIFAAREGASGVDDSHLIKALEKTRSRPR